MRWLRLVGKEGELRERGRPGATSDEDVRMCSGGGGCGGCMWSRRTQTGMIIAPLRGEVVVPMDGDGDREVDIVVVASVLFGASCSALAWHAVREYACE
jgi:hypothetical protein